MPWAEQEGSFGWIGCRHSERFGVDAVSVLAACGRGFWNVAQGLVNARQALAVAGGVVQGGSFPSLIGAAPQVGAAWAKFVPRGAAGPIIVLLLE